MTGTNEDGLLQKPAGPVHVAAPRAYAQRPLGIAQAVLDPRDELGRWQGLNASATLPHVVAQMEASGVLPNLRRVLDGEGEFVGMWFADSDLYKTLEAIAWETARTGTNPFPEEVDDAIDLLTQVQDEDGYLNSYFQTSATEARWSNMIWGHELYCAGHLIQAAVAWKRAAGDDRLLGIATRFADHLYDVFGPDGRAETAGHPEIETALVELFRETGDDRYVELCQLFLDRRSHVDMRGPGGISSTYYVNDVPVREADSAVGHAVRQLYLTTGVIDLALETGDRGLKDAALRVWTDAIERKTYVTGGQGARHRDESFGDAYELPAERAYAETCAAIASLMLSYRLLLATDDVRFAYEMERVLRNGVLSGLSLDGQHFFYSNPLQMRTGHLADAEDSPAERLRWYGCACCPPNLARLAASLGSYVATTDDAGLTLQIPVAATMTAEGTGWSARVRTETDAPYGGDLTAVVEASEGWWRLRLRMPYGAASVAATLNGEQIEADACGYLDIAREWASGDRLDVRAAVPVRVVHPHPYADAMRGAVAVMRGPLVYCLETASAQRPAVLEDLSFTAESIRAAEPVSVPELDTVGLRFSGVEVKAGTAPLYSDAPFTGEPAPIDVIAIPYARWANRGPTAMRVWLPEATSSHSPA